MSEFEDENGTVKMLRERGDKAEARVKELESLVKGLRSQVRQTTFKPLLSERGVPDKVANLIPDDVESPEAVAAWLDEYGFKAPEKAPATEAATPATDQAPKAPAVDAGTVNQIAAIQRVEAGSTPEALVGVEREIARIEELKNDPDLSFEKLQKMLFEGKL